MQTFRSLLYMLGMIVLIVITVILLLVVYPFSTRAFYWILRRWNYVSMRLLEWTCGLHYVVDGWENIPERPDYIILCRHQSAWETVALQEIFGYPLTWVLKRSLLWVPFFGWALAMQRSIGINRASAKQALRQLVNDGIERLDAGYKVIIFPEGTRTEPDVLGKFKIGGSMLAAKSGRVVVPVSHNAGRYWPKRGIVKHRGLIRVVIGKPIITEGKSASEVQEELLTWMSEHQHI
jgi:1-acyl-sn-glycerol-3-phosphate acyltransferase